MIRAESDQTRHVSRQRRCACCRWWCDGTCRKFPPRIVAGQAGGAGHAGVWPETRADSWCGGFDFAMQDA